MGKIRSYKTFSEWEKDFIYLAYPLFDASHIAQILNRDRFSIYYFTKKYGIKKPSRINEGDVFYKLTVSNESRIDGNGKKAKTIWKCYCECGNEKWVLQESLLNNKTKSCGCWHRKWRRTGTQNIAGWFFCTLKIGAKKRNIPFNITIEELDEIFVKQNFKCKLTNLPLILDTESYAKISMKTCTVSVDRIDSTKGYAKDNIQIVHVDANIMKGMYSQQHFINICHLVAKNTEYIEDFELLENHKKECFLGKKDRFNRNMNYEE